MIISRNTLLHAHSYTQTDVDTSACNMKTLLTLLSRIINYSTVQPKYLWHSFRKVPHRQGLFFMWTRCTSLHQVLVTSCGEAKPHLLMSFQLTVGLLTVTGTGLASLALSKPLMKQGNVSRQVRPSAQSVNGGILIFLIYSLLYWGGNKLLFIWSNLSSVPPVDAGRGRWVQEICTTSRFGGQRCGSASQSPCMRSWFSSERRGRNNLWVETAQTHSCSTKAYRSPQYCCLQHSLSFLYV